MAHGRPGKGSRGGTDARWPRILRVAVGVAIVGGIFAGVIPKIADYSSVGRILARVPTSSRLALLAVAILNLVSYWPQMMAAMPGLTLAQAAVNNQATTAIANTIPGGGALAVGVSYSMFRSWGFTTAEVALLAGTTGIWNSLIKFLMPAVALAILAIGGDIGRGLLAAALIGLGALAVSLVVLLLSLWKESVARATGRALGRAIDPLRRLLHRPPVRWADRAAKFRRQGIDLVRGRWLALTVTTVISHASLYLVLLESLRAVGVPASRVTWAEALGVFAFARFVSAFPLTPGGLGVVELSYIGGLTLAGGTKAAVVAGVLLFRALTFGVQIPLGPLAYVIWRRRQGWQRRRPRAGRFNPRGEGHRAAGAMAGAGSR